MCALVNDGQPFRSRDYLTAGYHCETEFRRSVAAKEVRPVFKSVYVDSRVPDSRQLRIEATRLVTSSHVVVCDEFASWLFSVDTFRPSERHVLAPTVLTPHGAGRVRAAGVRGRQAVALPDSDITEISGIRVTTPLRTTSDLLRSRPRPYALAAADGIARAGLIDLAELVEYVDGLRRLRGAPQARELARLVDPNAESRGESWQRMRIIDAGFPRPSTRLHVVDEWGQDRYFDMGYPSLLIAAEYDGREFHTTAAAKEHDRERREYFERRYGWRFVIGTRERIFGKDTSFEEELGALLGMTPLPRRW